MGYLITIYDSALLPQTREENPGAAVVVDDPVAPHKMLYAPGRQHPRLVSRAPHKTRYTNK